MSAECLWCHNPLPKRRRKYCCDECGEQYFRHNIAPLWWNVAKKMARERAGEKCEKCGSNSRLEVHHKEKVVGNYQNNPANRQENLIVLCRPCHKKAHHSCASGAATRAFSLHSKMAKKTEKAIP